MANLIDTKTEGKTLHLRVKVARLDASAARSFKQETERVWSEEVEQVCIDMEAVGFIDSSGIGALLSVYKKLPPGMPSVTLRKVQPAVESVIELLRLHRIFELSA
jgi:anti-sigma B factor antagonist